MEVLIKFLHEDIEVPKYETIGSSGVDLKAYTNENITINPNEIKLIKTGICIVIPNGYEGQVRPRSGLAIKNGITILNTPGTIDSDYRGEIGLIVINHGNKSFVIENGMRMGQLVFAKCERVIFKIVKEFDTQTIRGVGGFGSTGI
jgi:dUTP pyrophosphatase